MTLFSHSSFRSIEPISLNEPFTQLNSTQLNHTEVKTYGALWLWLCFSFLLTIWLDGLRCQFWPLVCTLKRMLNLSVLPHFTSLGTLFRRNFIHKSSHRLFVCFMWLLSAKKHEAKMIGHCLEKGGRSIADGRADGKWRRIHCVPYVIQLFARPFRTSLRTLRNGNQSISQCANNSIVTVLLTMSLSIFPH